MKKYLLMLLAMVAVVFVACDDDDNYGIKKKDIVLTPNTTDFFFAAGGGEKYVDVSNVTDVNIVKVNGKTKGTDGKYSETDVYSVEKGTLPDTKHVTQGGWFTATVTKIDGAFRITFVVSKNSDKTKSRDKYIHVDCGDEYYDLSLHVMKEKEAEEQNNK